MINQNPNPYYINQHKQAFGIEPIYPLPLFEAFVERSPDWKILECSCKIQGDRLEPMRFNLFCGEPNADQYAAALNFFQEVASRSDVNLNYDLLSQFIGHNFDFSKVVYIALCVNLRTNLRESSLKFAFTVNDYPEKLAEAIQLCQCSQELRWFLSNSSAAIGFDVFFDGRSEIEIYVNLGEEQLKDPKFQKRLSWMLSPAALELLENSDSLLVGFSPANPEKVLYFHPRDLDNFIARLRNDLANRVHAFYRHQPVGGYYVALRESEILTDNIENINLYYTPDVN